MQIIELRPDSIDSRLLEKAVDTLRSGGIIIYPTDSLYAVGCSSQSPAAVEKLCKIKKLDPRKNTLSVVCSDFRQASQYAHIDNTAFSIIKRNTPGAFTFILPAANSLPKVMRGRHTVGIRIPNCNIARQLAAELEAPLTTTSVPDLDPDTQESPLEMAERLQAYGIDMVVDGGDIIPSGPSTIVDLTSSSSPEIVRQGIAELE